MISCDKYFFRLTIQLSTSLTPSSSPHCTCTHGKQTTVAARLFYGYSMTLCVLSMTGFYLFFLNGAINQCGIKFFVPQKLLYLLNWHSARKQIRGNRPPKSMRVRLFDSGPLAELPKHILDSGHGHATVRLISCHEKWITVFCIPLLQISLQIEFGTICNLRFSLFAPLTVHNQLLFSHFNVSDIQ